MSRRIPEAWLPLATTLLAVIAAGCSSGGGDLSPVPLSRAASEYLRPPVGSISSESDRIVARAYDELLLSSSTEAARAAAGSLGDSPAAAVLEAQTHFLDGRGELAEEALRRVSGSAEMPLAGALLSARLAENRGDIVSAYEGYRGIALRDTLADRRASALEDEALEATADRFRAAIANRRLDEARRMSGRIETWAPSSSLALESRWRLIEISGDREAELDLLRDAESRNDVAPELAVRRAELELELGDAQTALRLFEELSADDPENTFHLDNLERARFRWRLQVLPETVGKVATKSQLDRSDLATLLYWLAPGVRSAGAASGRIASDILDVQAERRQEIARVLNLEIMDVDPVKHRFEPRRILERSDALSSVLRVLAQARPRPQCVSRLARTSAPAADLVCSTAAACRLVEDEAECLPTSPVSGGEAVELLRRGFAVLEDE